jgi:Arc/MetJ-type ribon-helix-helix transcriptional regulator
LKLVAYRNLSISLPEELIALVELVQRREHRSRSEVMREALRLYFERRGLIEDPLPNDLAALESARAEVARGETVTLEDALRELDRQADQASRTGTSVDPE